MPAVPLGKDSALQNNFPALAERDACHGMSAAIWFCIQATVLLSYPSLGYQLAVNPRKRRQQAVGGTPNFVCGGFWKKSRDTAGFCLLWADSQWLAQHYVAARRRLQKQAQGKLQNCSSGLERCKHCVHCSEGCGCKLSSGCALQRCKTEETNWLVAFCFLWGSFGLANVWHIEWQQSCYQAHRESHWSYYFVNYMINWLRNTPNTSLHIIKDWIYLQVWHSLKHIG